MPHFLKILFIGRNRTNFNDFYLPLCIIYYLNFIRKKVIRITEAQLFHSSNHHKWPPRRILGGKTVKNVKIGPQTTEIWPK